MTILSKGMKGAEVKALQTYLNSKGYSLDVDGSFGAKTDAAVRDYQKKNGLTVDGYVGPSTWASLLNDGKKSTNDLSRDALKNEKVAQNKNTTTTTTTTKTTTNKSDYDDFQKEKLKEAAAAIATEKEAEAEKAAKQEAIKQSLSNETAGDEHTSQIAERGTDVNTLGSSTTNIPKVDTSTSTSTDTTTNTATKATSTGPSLGVSSKKTTVSDITNSAYAELQKRLAEFASAKANNTTSKSTADNDLASAQAETERLSQRNATNETSSSTPTASEKKAALDEEKLSETINGTYTPKSDSEVADKALENLKENLSNLDSKDNTDLLSEQANDDVISQKAIEKAQEDKNKQIKSDFSTDSMREDKFAQREAEKIAEEQKQEQIKNDLSTDTLRDEKSAEQKIKEDNTPNSVIADTAYEDLQRRLAEMASEKENNATNSSQYKNEMGSEGAQRDKLSEVNIDKAAEKEQKIIDATKDANIDKKYTNDEKKLSETINYTPENEDKYDVGTKIDSTKTVTEPVDNSDLTTEGERLRKLAEDKANNDAGTDNTTPGNNTDPTNPVVIGNNGGNNTNNNNTSNTSSGGSDTGIISNNSNNTSGTSTNTSTGTSTGSTPAPSGISLSTDIDNLYNEIMNRKYTYNFDADPIYQEQRQQYLSAGQKAADDVAARAAALSGGYGNSYGASAAAQAYNEYAGKVSDLYNTREQQAYNRYQDETDELTNRLKLLYSMKQDEEEKAAEELAAQREYEVALAKAQNSGSSSSSSSSSNSSTAKTSTRSQSALSGYVDYAGAIIANASNGTAGESYAMDYLVSRVDSGEISEEEARQILYWAKLRAASSEENDYTEAAKKYIASYIQ